MPYISDDAVMAQQKGIKKLSGSIRERKQQSCMSWDYRKYTILLFYFMSLSVFCKIFFCKSNRIRDALRAAAENLACLHTF